MRSSFYYAQHIHRTRQCTALLDVSSQREPTSTGEQAARQFRPSLLDIDCILRLYQGIVKAAETTSGLGTRSQPEQSEYHHHQTADPAPCDMSMGFLGPTGDASGTINATKSTIASSRMNATLTLDAMTSAETITGGTPSPSVVHTIPRTNSQNGLWSTLSEFAAEPTSTVMTHSSRVNVGVTEDIATSAEAITGSPSPSSYVTAVIATSQRLTVSSGLINFSVIAAKSTSAVRLTIMITSTAGAEAATKTLSASGPSNDENSFWGTTSPISSFPMATAMAKTTTTEPAEIGCRDERAATRKSEHDKGDGDKPYDRCQFGSSSAGTSGLADMIPTPPALLLWLLCMIVTSWSVYNTVVKPVLGCIWPRSQGAWVTVKIWREGTRAMTISLVSEEKIRIS